MKLSDDETMKCLFTGMHNSTHLVRAKVYSDTLKKKAGRKDDNKNERNLEEEENDSNH